jgi:hypothetical protein
MVLTGVPRATVPARQARRRVRVLLAGAAAGPLLGLLALVVALGRPAPAAGRPAPAAGHDEAFATVAAEDVLAGRPTQLPYAAGLDPYLGRAAGGVAPAPIAHRSLAWRSAKDGRAGGTRYEVDTFVVATDDGGLWHLAIQVLDDPSGPVVGADPSLAPDPTAPSGSAQPLAYTPPGGVGGPPLSAGAGRQIQAWAAAYVGGDPATLYRLTGDTRDDAFATLVGWALDGAQVTGSTTTGGEAVAQVQVVMHLRAEPDDRVTAGYDLLLGGLGQSLPWVQAWGPPGSGPGLVPLADALPAGG